ncbi:MAG: transposase [bacterium]
MNYPSDWTDAQWETLHPLLEYSNGYGNRRQHPLHSMINAILYLVGKGCPWRQLPNDFPNWKSVYS